jgi:peptidylprolyl isomerase
VQDNYVVQWDDPDHHRPVPAGVRTAVEFTAVAGADARFHPLPDRDVYAPQVGFLDGFPAARDPRSHIVWLAHCYGMVGAGRDDPPESDGTEMYAVIGHAPRQLDRNVALVGRVLQGVDLLSSLPRGSGEMGFYVPSEPTVPIRSVSIAADVPTAERTPIEVLRTNSATFRAVLEQRRQRHEPWFKFSPDHIDLCNVPLPVRAIPSAGR